MRRIAVALGLLARLTCTLLVGVWAQYQHDQPLIKTRATPAPNQPTAPTVPAEAHTATPSSRDVALDG
jgi:hypothetical protein